MRLQDFGHGASAYERPNQRWTCGNAASGRACARGPDERGRCVADFECQPSRKGDRWVCARAKARGGPCTSGPRPDGGCSRAVIPCQPVRSLRSRRGLVAFHATAAVVALLAVAAGSRYRGAVFAPGDLSTQHGQILDAMNVRTCGACHSAGSSGIEQWLSTALGRGAQFPQSQLCLQCHAGSPGFGSDPLAPHGLARDELEPITLQALVERSRASLPLRAELATAEGSDVLRCASCHREHRGREHDLTLMVDVQCQPCHVAAFEQFSEDHPPFTDWPYVRRTGIAFDHAAHLGRHFADAGQSSDCRTCHSPDARTDSPVFVGYERACASCHDADIEESARRGVAVLQLPGVDAEWLADEGHDAGTWPEDAQLDVDGELNPFMRVLLWADEDARAALTALPDDFLFNEIDGADEEELAATARVAWGVKDLLHDIAGRGNEAISERLAAVLGRRPTDEELSRLSAGLSADTVRAALAAWMPEVFEEIPLRQGASLAGTAPTGIGDPVPVRVGWERDDVDFAVRHRPTGHADAFLEAWLDLVASIPGDDPAVAPLFRALTRDGAPGRCTGCHSVDRLEDGGHVVNWTEHRIADGSRRFTRFIHRPHVIQPELRKCTACHVVDEPADVMSGFEDHDPMTFASSFEPIAKDTCDRCHRPGGADPTCLACHQYHVGGGAHADSAAW